MAWKLGKELTYTYKGAYDKKEKTETVYYAGKHEIEGTVYVSQTEKDASTKKNRVPVRKTYLKAKE